MQELSAYCWSSASSESLWQGFSDFGSILFCAEYYCPPQLLLLSITVLVTFTHKCMEDIRALSMEAECLVRVFSHTCCFVNPFRTLTSTIG